jgi:hypothetical protein
VILLRTNAASQAQHDLVEGLRRSTGLAVWLVADETAQVVEQGPASGKIALTPGRLHELGLLAAPDAMWRCGDYALYAAAAALPEATQFWMVEPDVRIHMPEPGDFFAFFQQHSEVDFLACRLWETNAGWSWYASMKPYAERIFSCLFPLTRFSRRALDFLLLRRRALAALHQASLAGGEAREWPNDEVFCATELLNAGFRCMDFNGFGRDFYTRETFGFLEAVALSRLARMPHDGMIYHPVLGGEQLDRKLRQRLYHDVQDGLPRAHLLARYGALVMEDLALECGEAAALRFADDLAKAAGGAPADMPTG